ncbi:MAG TPA: hypothetical protein PKZ84_19040 [Anaerolineae bacterium]|nr:hypothetical protein [Anaerolineae bacterium]HQI86726.1 hypothetical protein [Anaerolineae bacterium]
MDHRALQPTHWRRGFEIVFVKWNKSRCRPGLPAIDVKSGRRLNGRKTVRRRIDKKTADIHRLWAYVGDSDLKEDKRARWVNPHAQAQGQPLDFLVADCSADSLPMRILSAIRHDAAGGKFVGRQGANVPTLHDLYPSDTAQRPPRTLQAKHALLRFPPEFKTGTLK